MSSDETLNVEFCRAHFPAMESGWVYLENAGGSLVPRQVVDRLVDFTTHCQVQPGEGYEASERGAALIDEGRAALADLINADSAEIVVGPSTTSNVYVLTHALRPLLRTGDEIIVTNQDHEANNGAWRALEETGVTVREWRMNEETDDLEAEDLEDLLSARTRIVCFTQCSNIVGLVHSSRKLVASIHDAGALACVDGVAMVPHRRVDVKDLGADIYLYSPYKVFGPHMGVMYISPRLLPQLASQSHYFLDDDDHQRRLCPGGCNYELTAASAGITAYLEAVDAHHYPGTSAGTQERIERVFRLFARHERSLSARIEDFLLAHSNVRLAGGRMAGRRERVGVFSFLVDGCDSRDIPARLREHRIGLHADDFYAARCIDALGARAQNGFVRASMLHYNSFDDIERLIVHLEPMF